jgi:hypothetical protein
MRTDKPIRIFLESKLSKEKSLCTADLFSCCRWNVLLCHWLSNYATRHELVHRLLTLGTQAPHIAYFPIEQLPRKFDLGAKHGPAAKKVQDGRYRVGRGTDRRCERNLPDGWLLHQRQGHKPTRMGKSLPSGEETTVAILARTQKACK